MERDAPRLQRARALVSVHAQTRASFEAERSVCAVARPHLANPAWTLTEAARIGYTGLAWPQSYVSGKPQLEAGFARERALQAQAQSANEERAA